MKYTMSVKCLCYTNADSSAAGIGQIVGAVMAVIVLLVTIVAIVAVLVWFAR